MKWRAYRMLVVLGLFGWGWAAARPVAIAGVMQSSALDTRLINQTEMLAVWTLPRLGVAVRNDPRDLRLQYAQRELRFSPAGGWQALGFPWTGSLPGPEALNGSLHVPLDALKLLGVGVLSDLPELLDFAAPAAVPLVTLPPSNAAPEEGPVPGAVEVRPATPILTVPPLANLDTVRVSRTLYRTVEVQRVVLELSGPAPHAVQREATGLSISLTGVTTEAVQETLESGDRLSLEQQPGGALLRLDTNGGRSEIFTLPDPYRVVIDTTTYTDASVPPPINPAELPAGVTYQNRGLLHLLSFDPQLYQPRVVSAPRGNSQSVAELVKAAGGLAGVNGGYFDPASSLPVDLVQIGGLMTAGSLEKRATVGFTAQGQALFGYPKPRYVLSGPFGSFTVNSVRSKPSRDLLTAFVGDGRTSVGADVLTTLYVNPGGSSVARALTGEVTPPAGTLALTFDPLKFPLLPRAAGAPLSVTLNWRASDAPWDASVEALSAGPLLVQGGQVAIDPAREGFDTETSVWRPTRQVALGTLNGRLTIAYYEFGTPESFAAVLAGAGLRDAVRLDSGSSATAYLSGGFANLGAYLNTVWSRPVPNAIVFVPRATAARK